MKRLFFLLSLLGLAGEPASAQEKAAANAEGPAPTFQHSVPENIADGWETALPSSVGFDPSLRTDLLERIRDKTYKNIHGILLVKDGKLVVEEYFRGRNLAGKEQDFQRDTLHPQQSVTKSVTSLLIGIAIDQHLIGGVEEKISTFLPEQAGLFARGAKDMIRLKHLSLHDRGSRL
ncbi:MAG: serine hydrolase, partial [Pirellulaceae bacterium]|nr:serine hydrolase [Pirellulaceae bacterium]